ncbi:MAG: 3-hydroxybutyrate dehydrogenase [Myxococcota bacterium]
MSTRPSVLVTGSTSGIGFGIARAFAQSGYNVTLNGLGDPTEIEQTRSQLATETGMNVRFSGSNMLDPAAIEKMVDEHVATLGGISVLVNNAGIQYVSPVEDFPVEKWDAIIGINLTSAFHTARASIPHMKNASFGRIINLASAHGLVASEYKSAYVAAKHGIVGLTKVIALEVARDNITCNAICPGYVQTPLVEKQIDEQAKSHGIDRDRVIHDVLLAKQPNKTFVTVEQIGALATFIASEAGATITGTALPIDGGWTAQ